MDTGDTRSVNILEAISDHNTYKIFKLVSMRQDGYTIEQLSKELGKEPRGRIYSLSNYVT